jgi:hypothetical protein
MSDKRRWIRIKPSGLVPRTGRILVAGSVAVIECRVLDLSAGGACLEFSRRYDLPKRFTFLHGTSRTLCRLAWIRGYRAGIEYEAPEHKAMSGGGLRRAATGLSRLSRERYS